MTLADFEARYVAHGDPWGYAESDYEQRKYAATLAACGPGPFACALELGGSIGVFSAQLAPRCRRLVTVDAAPTAVAAARARLAGAAQVEVVLGTVPDAIPQARYDLVLASEILYYLDALELDATLRRLAASTGAGARLVAVHWRPSGPERPLDAAQVHATLARQPWLEHAESRSTADYRLDAWERR
jgi:hypothetical protein